MAVFLMVLGDGIEPPTRGFLLHKSQNNGLKGCFLRYNNEYFGQERFYHAVVKDFERL